jgi:CRP-like cAMP-binding protein
MQRLQHLARTSASVVVRRLSAYGDLTSADVALLDTAGSRLARYPNRSELAREGQELRPLILLEGWACRQRVFPDGRRQVVSFFLPGDLIGSILDRDVEASPCSVIALTSIVAAEASSLRRALLEDENGLHAGLALACRAVEKLDQWSLLNHISRLGRQTAYERMAHLLLEFCERLETIGHVHSKSFTMPLTQEVLADALGLSIVHVNRTLQQLRRDGFLELRGAAVVLKDHAALEVIADYRPAQAE